jgi:hypothetical protein
MSCLCSTGMLLALVVTALQVRPELAVLCTPSVQQVQRIFAVIYEVDALAF